MEKFPGVKLRRNSSFNKTVREKGSPDIRRRSIPLMVSMPVDRESMLVMEANEISQYLKKHYRFSRDKDGVVKVVNTMLGLSCLWTMERLKERLVSMRKLMYAADTDKSAMAGESVFFDPADTWTKEQDDINIHIMESPRMKKQEAKKQEMKKQEVNKQEIKKQEVTTSRTNTTTSSSSGIRNATRQDTVPMTSSRPSSRGRERSETPVSNSRPLVCEVYPTVKSKQRNDVTSDNDSPGESPRASHSEPVDCASLPRPIKSQSPVPTLGASSASVSAASSAKSLSSSLTASLRKSANSLCQEETSRQQSISFVNASCQTDRQLRSSPVVGLSLDMIKLLRDRLRTGYPEGNVLVDQILGNCESLKVVVVNILEGFSQVQDSGDEIACFNDSDLMKTSSMQLVSALELLVSNTLHLLNRSDVTNNEVTSSIQEKISSTRNDLATELIILLHECQNSSSSGVEESSSRVLEMVYDMVNHCGQYYMTIAETCPNSLKDSAESTIQDLVTMRSNNGDHDILNKPADTDIKQSFVSGADAAMRLVLDEAQTSIHRCEKDLLVLAENASKSVEEIIIQCHRVVGASRCLVKLLKQIQTQVSKRLLEDITRAKNYYCLHYSRDLETGTKVNTLVSGLTMLSQATSSLLQAEDQGNFRRILRCIEIVQNSINSLLLVSKYDIPMENVSKTSENQSKNDISSVLSAEEADRLENASCDVTKATEAMISIVKQHIVDDGTACKSRRMLPAPPAGKGIVRCNSARSATDKRNASRQKSLAIARNHEI